MNSVTSKPKLAVLAPTLDGGIGRVMVNLLNHLVKRDLAIDVLLQKDRSPFVKALDREIRIIKLPSTHLVSGIPSLILYFIRHKPDILITESMRANALAIRSKRLIRGKMRVFASIHNTYSMTLASRKLKKRASLLHRMRTYLPQNDGIIAVSKGVAQDLEKLLELPAGRITVIYNPVVTPEIDHLSRQPTNHDWLKDPSIPVVMSAGRLHAQKDYPSLLRAFQIVSKQVSCRLLILGDGEEKQQLESLVHELGIVELVNFVGFTENPYQYMRQAQVFVLSSKWEGFGNVLAEALAVGCPVISTDCPSGPREILQDGLYGQLVPVADVNSLANAILKALQSKHNSNLLTEAADRFTVEAVASEYCSYLGINPRKS